MKNENIFWNIGFWTISLCLIASGIAPHDRMTWCMEVPWIFVGLGIVAWLHLKGIRISGLLGWALFIHALILIYGGYYTYEQAPPGFWMQDIFGFTRNHYDRIGHFAQGFCPAILYREVLYRNNVVNGNKSLEIIVFACCMAFTAMFELIEFASALMFGNASTLYLGSQGDVWDAQWDMVFCGIGGIMSIITLSRAHKKQMDSITNKIQ